MLHWLLSLPWPTWDHLFQYFVVLVIFFAPKKVLDLILELEWKWVQKLIRKTGFTAQRRLDIKLHVRQKHGGKYHECENCTLNLERSMQRHLELFRMERSS